MNRLHLVLALGLALACGLRAELKLPAIISDHMVLQQKQRNPIWGWDEPGTRVTVRFAGRSESATADATGRWTVKIGAGAASSTPQTLLIAGSTRRQIQDVLVGEVWMCSGQSNMAWVLRAEAKGDLEAATAHLPNIRYIRVPQVGTQELQNDFEGEWKAAIPETALTFSAVGFLYGRYLHQILGVPVGLIDNSWGGSAAQAWVRRETIEQEPRFASLMTEAGTREAELQSPAARAELERAMEEWTRNRERAKAQNRSPPRPPGNWLAGQHRPGNIFAGMVHPTLGYGIKGVIWYQGESNAGQAHEYRALFPFLIEEWRREWGQGDFPFYWVQLADYRGEPAAPGDSDWAELREAQTLAMRLPNTGQAVIIDLGEGKDIHPRNKVDVAARLVRWPLVKDYGKDLPYRSPEFKSLAIDGGKAVVTIDCFGSRLRPFDVKEAVGFAVCGEDRVWHWAEGQVVDSEQVEVWSDAVPAPVAVRYAWADNPVCNLYSETGLPVTPFRTDDFEMITKRKE